MNQVVTGVCTIGADSSIKIETNVKTKKKNNSKKVTFSREPPSVISYDPEEEDEEISNHNAMKTETNTATTVSCKKCKEKKRIDIRLSMTLGMGEKEKVKKSLFDVVFKWFSKFL